MANSSFNNWSNILAPTRNEIVFSGRNQAYGAFELRKHHNRTIALALFISAGFFLLMVSVPGIINKFSDNTVLELPKLPPPLIVDYVNPVTPPPIEEPAIQSKSPVHPKIDKTFTDPIVRDRDEPIDPLPTQSGKNIETAGQTQTGTAGPDINLSVPGALEADDKKPAIFVEEMPEFPGGYSALGKWLQENLVFPEMEREAKISGVVYVEFTVSKQGDIIDAVIKRGVTPAYDKEALRAVNAMPKWKPGRQNGNPLYVRFTLPIKFSLK